MMMASTGWSVTSAADALLQQGHPSVVSQNRTGA